MSSAEVEDFLDGLPGIVVQPPDLGKGQGVFGNFGDIPLRNFQLFQAGGAVDSAEPVFENPDRTFGDLAVGIGLQITGGKDNPAQVGDSCLIVLAVPAQLGQEDHGQARAVRNIVERA